MEAAGVAQPDSVNGTPQKPIEGKSFLASLTDADAAETRTGQYFEMFANRAMYKDGWWLASIAFEPWQPLREGYDPFAVNWELYNLNEDFSQGQNLAEKYPEKVKELEALWWAQASKYDALPLDWRGSDRFSAELTGKPNLAGSRTKFVYPGDFSGLPEASAPDLKNKSFSIRATIEVDENANGMIYTQGGNTAGWALYMQEGKLILTHNFIDLQRYTVSSDEVIPAGKHELTMEFTYEGGKEMGKSGTVQLSVDGTAVGSGKIEKTTPFKYSMDETQDIGKDNGTPVTYDYQTPFAFEGEISQVVVELKK